MAEKVTPVLKSARKERQNLQSFFNIAVSVDCVIFGYDKNELFVLLRESELEEYQGLYSLMGDLVRPNEDLTEASYRILFERPTTGHSR